MSGYAALTRPTELHLEGIVEDDGEVPVPRAIGEHLANPDFVKGVWATVDVNVSRFDGRAEKVNITLPRRLLARIDSYAKAHGKTRSGFLADAARAAMRQAKT
ncbi:MAG: type II toxin-antitoxin system HicB family antitoxin [Candidatus Accumulibacter sp.]|uniref:Type II toxin-antitoxin system HicB family antitoxin n=1 Tax=Candidatus Accumulibacter affinis TaxID=2954384 RepID=A0A935T7L6_9PROT|nr:type II toxin-antitoxin system HicB family antitoxin [Candidatus Accumulibacter affinis]